MNINWDKFQTLVHHVCNLASPNQSELGAVKLNKVLWYADSIHFLEHGESITGETYVKQPLGPVPKHVLQALKNLEVKNLVRRGKVEHFGLMKNEYFCVDEPDISCFSSEQQSLIQTAYNHVCKNHTATSISEETHGIIWSIAEIGEEIPLATVFASSVGEIDETDMDWMRNSPRKNSTTAEYA